MQSIGNHDHREGTYHNIRKEKQNLPNRSFPSDEILTIGDNLPNLKTSKPTLPNNHVSSLLVISRDTNGYCTIIKLGLNIEWPIGKRWSNDSNP